MPSSGRSCERDAHLLGAVAELGERGAHLGARRRPPVAARLDEVEVRDTEAVLQLDHQLLGGALPHPGHEAQRVDVVVGDAPAQRARRVDRQHREPELGTDPARADEHLERVALVAGREPVERHRVLAHVEVGEEERRARGHERGHRAERDEAPVADASDLDQHLAGRAPLQHRAAHGSDHRLPPSLASAAATASCVGVGSGCRAASRVGWSAAPQGGRARARARRPRRASPGAQAGRAGGRPSPGPPPSRRRRSRRPRASPRSGCTARPGCRRAPPSPARARSPGPRTSRCGR